MSVAYVAYQRYHKWLAQIPHGTSAVNKKMMVFMIAATWSDQIKSEQGYTDDGTQGGNRPDGATSVQNIGYTDHLHHKYWHFVDTPFSTDGTRCRRFPLQMPARRSLHFVRCWPRMILMRRNPTISCGWSTLWAMYNSHSTLLLVSAELTRTAITAGIM